MGSSSLVGSAPCRDPGPEDTLGLTSRGGGQGTAHGAHRAIEGTLAVSPAPGESRTVKCRQRRPQTRRGGGGPGSAGLGTTAGGGRGEPGLGADSAGLASPARRCVETIQVGCGFRFYRVTASSL